MAHVLTKIAFQKLQFLTSLCLSSKSVWCEREVIKRVARRLKRWVKSGARACTQSKKLSIRPLSRLFLWNTWNFPLFLLMRFLKTVRTKILLTIHIIQDRPEFNDGTHRVVYVLACPWVGFTTLHWDYSIWNLASIKMLKKCDWLIFFFNRRSSRQFQLTFQDFKILP